MAKQALTPNECFCVEVDSEEEPKRLWYDTRQITLGSDFPEDHRFVAEAVEYLELRGLLLRREGAPHVVSFRQPTHGEPQE